MRGRQRLLFFTVAAAMVLVASTAAQAASVATLFHNDPAFVNVATDDSFEYLIDRDWGGVGTERGDITVGDSLRGMFEITVVNSTLIGSGSTFTTEWTGVFQVKVLSRTPEVDADLDGISDNGKYFFTFGPDALFAEAIGLGVDGNAMVIFYEQAVPDYNPFISGDDGTGGTNPDDSDVSSGPYATEEGRIATASNGTAFWALGFTGAKVGGEAVAAAGEGWAVTTAAPGDVNGPGDPGGGGLFAIGPGVSAGFANFAMNKILLGGGAPGDSIGLVKQASPFGGVVDFVGTVNIEGVKGLNVPFEAADQSQFTFHTVPIPGAAWTGLAMLGLLGFVRVRRRAARIV